MRSAMTLTAAVLALAISGPSASAQRDSGGGGTIGCDPGAPNASVKATNCSVFFKEALYGPSANPYASGWVPGHSVTPVVKHRKEVVHPSKARTTRGTGD